MGSVLHTLALTAPHVEVLTLLGSHHLSRKHLLYLECFTSLQELFLDHFRVDETILRSISNIPTINDLNVTIRLRGQGRVALDLGDSFQGLSHLTLRGVSKDLSDVVAAMSAPSLEWFELQFTDSVGAATLDASLTAIASHIPDTITHCACIFRASLSPLPTSLAGFLQPLLLKMPNLESFDLSSKRSPLSITNDDLIWFGDAWPKLHHLNIRQWTYRFNHKNVRRPNVSGLAELAKRCPNLRMLCLPELDISRTTEPKVIRFIDHRLEYLLLQSVSTAPTQALHEVAVAIDAMFPHLNLHKMRPIPGGPSTQWVNVWKTLWIMRWGRRNYTLSEDGVDSTVLEVPDISLGRDDRAPRPNAHDAQVRHNPIWLAFAVV